MSVLSFNIYERV